MRSVGVRQLRQNLSVYLRDVKAGEILAVTEHGREVARLVPSGVPDDPLSRLSLERGATRPTGSLGEVGANLPPAGGRPSGEVLDEQRGDRG